MLKNSRKIFAIIIAVAVMVQILLYSLGIMGPVETASERFIQDLLGLFFIGIIIYPIFTGVVKSVTDRMDEITRGLDRVHSGDYSTDIVLTPMSMPFHGKDELGRISEGINSMQIEVAKREQKLLFKQESVEGMLRLLTSQADELRTNYEIYRIISEETNDGTIRVDIHKGRMIATKTKRILGYEPEDFDDTIDNWMALVHPEDRDAVQAAFRSHANGASPLVVQEYRMKSKDGHWHWILTRAKRLESGGRDSNIMVGSSTYIETWKRAQESIYRLAYYNQLSNLPNRFAFLEALEQRIMLFEDSNRRFILMLINLDRFKRINDLAGHEAGDRLICQVADSLRNVIDPSDFLGHINGDEFVILSEFVEDDEVETKLETLVNLFKYSWLVDDRSFHITASVGVATFPKDSMTGKELLKRSDMALSEAKEAGGNVGRCFTASMDIGLKEKLETESALRVAVVNREFEAYYQPQLSAEGKVVGFEALMRWIKPSGEIVPPDRFIPFAEETGLIIEMGDIILEKVCMMAKEMGQRGYSDLTFSVNLSPVQFDDGRLVQKIRDAITKSGVSPSQLVMEITESLAMENFNYVNEVLQALKSLGIRIALDDFGKGYSSLNYLRSLSIDILKIDKDFISGIGNNREDEIILDHIIGIAQEMKLPVVAEGVETLAQFEYLKQRRCDDYQGYFFSRPVPAAEVYQLLS